MRALVISTSQHDELLNQALDSFGIRPDVDLDLMRPDQTLADLTSRMIAAVYQAFRATRPSIVIGQGDTTTALVSALSAFYSEIPFSHIEAGLRTNLKYSPFPEEMNRSLIGRLADLHFAPTARSRANLFRERIDQSATTVTGSTAVDALNWGIAEDLPEILPARRRDHRLILVTDRREDFGRPLEGICDALLEIANSRAVEILFPVHLNPNVRNVVTRRLKDHRKIHLIPPLGYAEFLSAMNASDGARTQPVRHRRSIEASR